MKKTLTLPVLSLTFLYSFASVLVPSSASAQTHGSVGYALQWQGPQTYTYVFSGVVSLQGKPSSNVKVQLHFNGPHHEDLVQETIASADGSYELKVALEGVPADSAEWKLVAQATESQDSAEVGGRMVFTEGENTVTVEKPLQLGVQG